MCWPTVNQREGQIITEYLAVLVQSRIKYETTHTSPDILTEIMASCLEPRLCFAHLRWCHNGWASNILIVVDTSYAGIHHSKYWMPIHYDTIEDGQNKKSHLLFSFLVRIVLFLHFICGIYLSTNIITSFHWFHLNNYTPYENKCFNPRNQIHRVQMRHAIRGVHAR